MDTYIIPAEVSVKDAEFFRQKWQEYKSGELDFKGFEKIRVAFGIYEQRVKDSYMARVKTHGGGVGAKEFARLGELCKRYANGFLHLSTRASIQLHFVKDDEFIELENEIAAINMTTRGACGDCVRGVVCDALAGVAKDEAFNVLPYANAITSMLIGRADSYGLSRKFKIAFSGSKADRANATITDAGFVATKKGGKKGFIVYVAGGMGSKPRLGDKFKSFIPANEAFLYAQAIKLVFAKTGDYEHRNSARLRHAAEKLGKETIFKMIEDEVAKIRASSEKWKLDIKEPRGVKPLVSEPRVRFSAAQKAWAQNYVTAQKQKGYYYAVVPFLWGNVRGDDAIKLSKALIKLGLKDSLFISRDQHIILKNLKKTDLIALYPVIAEISPMSADPRVFANMTPCTGASTCRLGICRPKGAVEAIHDHIRNSDLDFSLLKDIVIKMSGCPNSCTAHQNANLGFMGGTRREDGRSLPYYSVFAGGELKEGKSKFGKKVGGVAADHVPEFVYQTLKKFTQVKSEFKNFNDWVDNGGDSVIAELCGLYQRVGTFEENPGAYYDYGADVLFGETLKDKI